MMMPSCLPQRERAQADSVGSAAGVPEGRGGRAPEGCGCPERKPEGNPEGRGRWGKCDPEGWGWGKCDPEGCGKPTCEPDACGCGWRECEPEGRGWCECAPDGWAWCECECEPVGWAWCECECEPVGCAVGVAATLVTASEAEEATGAARATRGGGEFVLGGHSLLMVRGKRWWDAYLR